MLVDHHPVKKTIWSIQFGKLMLYFQHPKIVVVSWNRATSSHHPFDGVSIVNHPAIGYPICGTPMITADLAGRCHRIQRMSPGGGCGPPCWGFAMNRVCYNGLLSHRVLLSIWMIRYIGEHQQLLWGFAMFCSQILCGDDHNPWTGISYEQAKGDDKGRWTLLALAPLPGASTSRRTFRFLDRNARRIMCGKPDDKFVLGIVFSIPPKW